ncbi:hypothetical protein M408DRAFT_328179 [Serendipita vermifera MAFF 305830]|uniref:Mitochondrial carrier n=1 Tax=Serendipita vermifera MAFF 305830 TaxID=933852 RepID=A0A0C3B1G8_SERVB|nr:hypothetical protein M408DRAFT_328179 [Serendipita vermifera MAFF 305830]
MIVTLILVAIAGLIGLGINVPLVGALIRFRANYTPRSLHLDQEGQPEPHAGPVISNYFAMLFRIKRIEGWSGLWKGYMPSALSSIIIITFVGIIGASMSFRPGGAHTVEIESSFRLVLYASFLALLTTPFTVIINRAITTPHKLPWFAPLRSLQILLTPYELHRPWALYLGPGLLLARSLHVFWLVFVQRGMRRLLLPDFKTVYDGGDQRNMFTGLSPIGVGFYIAFVGISAVLVLTPLEVIATRLSVQRNNSQSGGFGPAAQDEDQPDLEFAGRDEDVIALRPEDQPYSSFIECGKTILEEEGPETLLRAWWVTMAATLIGAFS